MDELLTYITTVISQAKADYCEVRWEEMIFTRFLIKNSLVQSAEESEVQGGCIRVLKDGAWGIVTFVELAQLEKNLSAAINFAKISSQYSNKIIKLADVYPQQAIINFPILENPCDLSLAYKLGLFTEYSDFARSLPSVDHCVSRYYDETKKNILVTSEGTRLIQTQLDLYGSLTLSANRKGKSISVPTYGGSSNDFNILRNIIPEIETVEKHLAQLLQASPIQAGTYPVVMGQKLASLFIHEAFGHFCEADSHMNDARIQELMRKGRSLSSTCVNIYDSGLQVGTRGYVPFDDEGVPSQRTDLIRDGKLVGRLHSRETATWFGEQPTGNARAISFRFSPICRMTTISAEPGELPIEDMISHVSLGVYADEPYGGKVDGENFNFVALNVRMIRQGKLAEYLCPVNLTGSLFHTLSKIKAVSSDYLCKETAGGCGKGGQGPLRVSAGSPHLLIQKLLVTPR
ncbi:MAG: TldD/PmbA family protein [Candidatus Parabeggiatoa sp.]|nr:TldD/PmbA family protein [Candidatus Parabeggiatoa sp.]